MPKLSVAPRHWIMSCILLFCGYMSYLLFTAPGVPYNVTVRASTAAGLGEPVSIVVFAVQQGNFEQTAEDYVLY